MRYYAGFDPGTSGAIAIFTEHGELEETYDMPVLIEKKKNGKVKKKIDVHELYYILLQYKILHAYVEHVHAMPHDGGVGGFSFGQSLGRIEGVLAASEIHCTLISPLRWKNYFNLIKKDKDLAREKAMHLFPHKKDLFRRKRDIDRAEACLICLAGMGRSINGVIE